MMTMYDIIMRTIVDLPSKQVSSLAELSRKQHLSRAEMIRRAVELYLKEQHAGAAGSAFGLWRGRKVDALKFEDRLRKEWESRS